MSTPSLPLSFEFFPPKTDTGMEKLQQVSRTLATLKPEFFSVTFGAGGSTRTRTLETLLQVRDASGIPTAPHLSCIGASREELLELLQDYQRQGIDRIVALRGDLPSGMVASGGEFRYANELVAFIREQTGDHFTIEVAAYPEYHPQALDAEDDLNNFKRKVNAGADSAITQYFYNADAYSHFVERCHQHGITIPIVPGIMPITNYSKLARFSDACGAEIPRWIRKQLQAYGDDSAAIQAFGTDVVSRLCEQLIAAGAPGLHIYSMNQSEATLAICRNLNLIPNA